MCGIRSKPFQWPGLSPQEHKDYLALCRTPYSAIEDTSRGMKSWFDDFCDKFPVNEETAEEVFVVSFRLSRLYRYLAQLSKHPTETSRVAARSGKRETFPSSRRSHSTPAHFDDNRDRRRPRRGVREASFSFFSLVLLIMLCPSTAVVQSPFPTCPN